MNVVLKQLKQWPPTATTVIGAGLLLFALDFWLTGNMLEAVTIAGTFKILCPQDAGAVDQAVNIATQFGEPHA